MTTFFVIGYLLSALIVSGVMHVHFFIGEGSPTSTKRVIDKIYVSLLAHAIGLMWPVVFLYIGTESAIEFMERDKQ